MSSENFQASLQKRNDHVLSDFVGFCRIPSYKREPRWWVFSFYLVPAVRVAARLMSAGLCVFLCVSDCALYCDLQQGSIHVGSDSVVRMKLKTAKLQKV